CFETICYSFNDPNAQPTGQAPLAPSIQKPLLLMVGEDDRYQLVDIRDNVVGLGKALTGPGRTQTVSYTGHSIHDERPRFLAQQVMDFVPTGPGRRADISYLVPLLLSD